MSAVPNPMFARSSGATVGGTPAEPTEGGAVVSPPNPLYRLALPAPPSPHAVVVEASPAADGSSSPLPLGQYFRKPAPAKPGRTSLVTSKLAFEPQAVGAGGRLPPPPPAPPLPPGAVAPTTVVSD
jgi:hypothetical protein